MRYLVFDVPAETKGALSILKEYYNKAINNPQNQWIFIVSTPNLKNQKNVKVIRYPWVKKSWGHRLFFDWVIAPKIVKNYKPNKVISLQNLSIPRIDINQVIYMHQSLPFAEINFSFLKHPKLWIYQNLIGKMIVRSLKKAEKVIVQSRWIKDAVVEQVCISEHNIKVSPPSPHITVKKKFDEQPTSFKRFFYPAGAGYYKNHRLIVNAINRLTTYYNTTNIDVYFTLRGNETRHVKKLKKLIDRQKLPIHFIGNLSQNEVFEFYSSSILIFPSYIETFGLPLLEARKHRTPIISIKMQFSLENLKGYDRVYYFKGINDCELLSELIMYNISLSSNKKANELKLRNNLF